MSLSILKPNGDIVSTTDYRVIWITQHDETANFREMFGLPKDTNEMILWEQKKRKADEEGDAQAITLEQAFQSITNMPYEREKAIDVEKSKCGTNYIFPTGIRVREAKCGTNTIYRFVPEAIENIPVTYRLMIQWGKPEQGAYGLLHESEDQEECATVLSRVWSSLAAGDRALSIASALKARKAA